MMAPSSVRSTKRFHVHSLQHRVQVDLGDDLVHVEPADQGVDVDLGQECVHQRDDHFEVELRQHPTQVDAIDDQPDVDPLDQGVEVEALDHRLDIDPRDEGVEVEALDERLHVDLVEHALDIDSIDDGLNVQTVDDLIDVDGVDDSWGHLVDDRLQHGRGVVDEGAQPPPTGRSSRHSWAAAGPPSQARVARVLVDRVGPGAKLSNAVARQRRSTSGSVTDAGSSVTPTSSRSPFPKAVMFIRHPRRGPNG